MDISGWLDWIKLQHTQEIDLSLERAAQVAKKLGLLSPFCPVVTVAGTNGKGSCVAGIEAIAMAAGYKVGAFTSPFLLHYNEQVRLQGKPVTNDILCDAFEEVAQASQETTLTLFEFGTLAAGVIFKKAELDVWILEVGMGGRFDAVNVFSADIAVVTSIAMDHMAWLGNTREAIAYEKAGIFRSDKPAVCGDFDPPNSIVDYAKQLKTPLFMQGKQFGFIEKKETWDWWSDQTQLTDLPRPSLLLQNMSTVLMTIELLQKKLPMSRNAINFGLKKVSLPGRIQVIPGEITRIFDVSHNPAAVSVLANYLRQHPCTGKTYAIFSMLADKDILESIRSIQDAVDYWYVAPVKTDRKASYEMLVHCFNELKLNNVFFNQSIKEAESAAMQKISGEQKELHHRLVVFGSFHTVSEFEFIEHHQIIG